MRRLFLLAGALAVGAVPVLGQAAPAAPARAPTAPARAPAQVAPAPCDRECLRGFVTQYLDALVAHRPETLPVAANLKFTEDGSGMKLGDGLWKTATRLRPYRMDFIDVRAGVAGAQVIVEEGTSPVLLVLRLRVADRKIAEAETLAVRNRQEGLIFEPDALKAVSPAMLLAPPRDQLQPRDEMVRIAELYPAGLRAGSFVKVDAPFAATAYRLENGRLMAGPGCTFAAGCDNIKSQRIPTLAETKYRLAAVDEELGIVWFRLDFGAGSVPGGKTKLVVFEAFKVYGGQIHAVEAFMESAPMGAGSGWDDVTATVGPVSGRDLVGTWTLDRLDDGADTAQPARITGVRGLLIVDGAGHIFEFVNRPPPQAAAGQPALTDAQQRFYASSGFWGGYQADAAQRRITITPEGAVHPNLMGRQIERSFQVTGGKLSMTSRAGEPHTRAVTRWTWERVPPVENLSAQYRQVVGFWQHVVEKRMNLTLGTGPESRRAPSVIVYTPSGFVGVHFPPLNRQPFAADVPTDTEARAALQGYVGYFGALTVYPGQVFHNILSGVGNTQGILKRSFALNGEEVNITFPITVNAQGQETTTYVRLKRLSGAAAMLPAP